MKTFKNYLIQLYGEQTHQSTRKLERSHIKQAKLINNLTFLKRCRDSHIVPPGLQLKSPIHTQRAENIIKKASIALTKERISHTRLELHKITQDINSSQDTLKLNLNSEDFDKIGKFNSDTAKNTFNTTKQKQLKKFDKLAQPTKPHQPSTSLKHKKTVINLSKRTLTTDEHQVLGLGLNFAVAPKKIPFSEVIQQVEPNLRHLNRAAADNIRLLVTQALSTAEPPKSNITKKEQATIKNLRSDTSIHILTADKGNATVIMEKQDYNDKMHQLLDTATYSKLPRDPTPATERRINQKLLSLQKANVLPKALYLKLRSSSATCPILFGQPKIHKTAIPLRPIVATRGSPTYNTARHLATILQPLVGTSTHHIINSQHFIEKLNQTSINPTDTLVSFDVESLFTSVPITESCDIIKRRLQADPNLIHRTSMSAD